MPVTTEHYEYSANVEKWTRCRDACDGADAIKKAGEKYLPSLTGQDKAEYEAYKMRAMWYGATGRTVQGLVGSVFRKAPTVEVPEPIEAHLADVTLTGVPFEGFCKTVLEEVLKTGRFGVLVDMAGTDPASERPYWVGYPAESIRNWATVHQAGDEILTLVVLYEPTMRPKEGDPFEWELTPQYRVLRLTGSGETAQYQVDIWRQREEKKDEWVITETLTPTLRGRSLNYIPFCFFSPTTITPAVEKPPLLDLVEVNLSHYRSSADLEHGRHFSGLPTPWVAGFPSETTLKIGSSIAWVANDPNAKAGMLEFTGQGLGALERALESKERLMAVLGARMLEEQKRAVEAADTHRIRHAGEQSVLSSIARTVEIGLTKVVQWHVAWTGLTTDTSRVELNKDFDEAKMDPTELQALLKTWQSGGISYETFYYNLQRGELARPGIDADEERRLIDQQAPARIPLEDGGNPEEDQAA